MELISKEKYVLEKVKQVLQTHIQNKYEYSHESIVNLIEQWEFDYDLEKEYRPEILKEN